MTNEHLLERSRAPHSPFWQRSWFLGVVFAIGTGWLLFPFDVRMIWTMAGSALLLSNAVAIVVAYFEGAFHGSVAVNVRTAAVAFLSLTLGMVDVHQALTCLREAGQM